MLGDDNNNNNKKTKQSDKFKKIHQMAFFFPQMHYVSVMPEAKALT